MNNISNKSSEKNEASMTIQEARENTNAFLKDISDTKSETRKQLQERTEHGTEQRDKLLKNQTT
ncbi:hypothetical protein K9M48_03165 [Candidatus Gracilibacteria bacterium]|nr:hypothetical protein [Candidatus Gracilibacteria bacterium]